MNRAVKKILCVFVCISMLFANLSVYSDAETTQIKNIIYMIPDGGGMAPFFLADYICQAGGFDKSVYPDITEANEGQMYIKDYLVGAETTRSASHKTTDSAAGGTALAGGYKTTNGMIGVSSDLKPHATILEACQYVGMTTGVVATHAITDATPAAFTSHAEARTDTKDIGEQEMYQGIDVLIANYADSYKNSKWYADETAQANGYKVVKTKEDLSQIQPGDKIYGKIPGLYYETQRDASTPNLAEITEAAIRAVDDGNEKGFFLMIEGSAIDGGGHDSSSVNMVGEWIALDAACKVAIEYAKNRNDTLVVILPDHDTGGLAVESGVHTKDSLEAIAEQVRCGTEPEGLPWEGYITSDANKRRSHTARDGGIFMYLPEGVEYPEGIDAQNASQVMADFENDFTVCETNRIDNTAIAPYLAEFIGADLDNITKELFVDCTDFGTYDASSGKFTMTAKDGTIAEIYKNNSKAVVNGETVDLEGRVAVYVGERFYAPAMLFEEMSDEKAGMKIYADYNSKTVTVDGVTEDGLADIAVVVTSPKKTVAESVADDGFASFPFITQTKSSPWREYTVKFRVSEGEIGDYKYYTRINNGKNVNEYTFSFKDMTVTKNGVSVENISQLSEGDKIELVLSGYDSSYNGMAVVAQYGTGNKLMGVSYENITGSAVNYTDNSKLECNVLKGVEKIKAFYWEQNSIAPFTGEYVID